MSNTVVTKGVITINGEGIENTWYALRKETVKLRKELRRIPKDTDEFIKKTQELKNVEDKFKEVDESIKNTNTSLDEAGGYIAQFFGGLSTGNFSMAQQGLRGIAGNFKGVLAAARALILTPIGAFVAVVAGIGVVTKKWFDYNKTIAKTTKLTKQLTNLSGKDLANHRDTVSVIAKQNNKSFDEILKAANSFSKQMNISQKEAIELINEGFIRGADINGDFLEKIKEYPVQFKNAGYSAQDFIDISTQEVKGGVFSDKLLDAIKEADLSLKEFTKAQEEALTNAFGPQFTNSLKRGIASGEITTKKAIEKIISQSKKMGLNFQQQQQLIADVFKGAGEDAGGFAEIVKQLDEAFKDENKTLDELEKATKRVTKANIEYKKAVASLTDASQSGFPEFVENWKAFGKETLTGILKTFKRIITSSEKLMQIAKNKGVSKAAENVLKDSKIFGTDIKEEADIKLNETKKDIERIKKDIDSIGIEVFGNKKKLLREKLAEQISYRDELLKIISGTSDKMNELLKQENKKKDDKKDLNNNEKLTAVKNKEDQLKKANRKLLELQQKLEDEKIKIKEDSQEKELEILKIKYEREKQKIKEENAIVLKEIVKNNSKIASLQERKAKTKNPKKQSFYNNEISKLQEINKKRVEITKANKSIIEQLEQTHQYKIDTIKSNWFVKNLQRQEKEIEKGRKLRIDQINNISSLEEAKKQLSESYSELELAKIKTIEDAKNKLREEANKKALKNSIHFLETQKRILEEGLEAMSGPAAEELKKNLEIFSIKITRLKGLLQNKVDGESGGDETEESGLGEEAGRLDILGFSAQQWADTFENLDTIESKLAAVGMVMTALTNIGSMFAEQQRALNQKELRDFSNFQENRTKVLKRQLNSGLIHQEEFYKETNAMEREAANKKAEMEYKQAQADKISRLFSAIGNVALGISSALTAPFPMNIALPIIVGALGAVQIGVIASQPLPPKQSYAKGGFTKGLGFKDQTGEEVAGVVHKDEYVVPTWLLKKPRIANMVQLIESERTQKTKPFNQGGYTSEQPKIATEEQQPANNIADSYIALTYAVNRLNENLEKIEENGIEAFLLADEKNGKLFHKAIKKFNTLQNKNKYS